MKALSLWQPWASLAEIRAKMLETRGQRTLHRGPLAIHAAQHWTPALRKLARSEPFRSALKAGGYDDPDQLPRGKIIATTNLTDCHRITATREIYVDSAANLRDMVPTFYLPPDEPELSFGLYTPGRFAFVFHNTQRLCRPFAFTGRQWLFDVPDELIAAAQEAA